MSCILRGSDRLSYLHNNNRPGNFTGIFSGWQVWTRFVLALPLSNAGSCRRWIFIRLTWWRLEPGVLMCFMLVPIEKIFVFGGVCRGNDYSWLQSKRDHKQIGNRRNTSFYIMPCSLFEPNSTAIRDYDKQFPFWWAQDVIWQLSRGVMANDAGFR